MSFVAQSALILAYCENINSISTLAKRDIFLKEKSDKQPRQLTNNISHWVINQITLKSKKTSSKAKKTIIDKPSNVEKGKKVANTSMAF
jgi:hypothetical protein